MSKIEKQKVILDNNIINYLINDDDFAVLFSKLKTTEYYVSASVIDEFNRIPDSGIDKRYLCFFRLLKLLPIPVEDSVAVWDFSKYGTAKMGQGIVYNKIKDFLNHKKKKKNNPFDAILADTAVSNGLTLITNDRNLFDAMNLFGYKAIFWSDLKRK